MNKKLALMLIFFTLFGFGYLHNSNTKENVDRGENIVIGEDVKIPEEFYN